MQNTSNIKPIDRKSIHQICSGQVVLTLATAVKELVENSIDAGATSVEVKLKEYGSELIEVCDNGSGVKECDFESLTLKHHTSKIEDFSDLLNVDTFGFRGEALSSLCALGKMTVITCHKLADVGSRLEYDHNGSIIKQTPSARQVGTTVCLERLFSTLPVRHKEFQRNLRKEFGKMVQLLTAYCIVSTGIRITCVNCTSKGRKTTVVSTSGDSNLKSNLICLFGSKQVSSILEFVQKTPSVEMLEEFGLKKNEDIYRIDGYISSPTHGEGRSSADRQFWFVNGRPCDIPKAAKVVNDVYHSFNRHQYPFICLNVKLTRGTVDVNITPDKRQVFVPEEKLLLATLKASVLGLYGDQPLTLKQFSPLVFQKTLKEQFQGNASSETSKTDVVSTGTTFLTNLKRAFSHGCKSQGVEPDIKNPRIETGENSVTKYDNDATSKSDGINTSFSDATSKSPDTRVLDTSDTCREMLESSIAGSATSGELKSSPANRPKEQDVPINSLEQVNFTKTQPFKEEKLLDKVKMKDFESPRSVLLKDFAKFARNSKNPCASSRVLKKKTVSAVSPRKRKLKRVNGDCRVNHEDVDIDLIINHHKRDLINARIIQDDSISEPLANTSMDNETKIEKDSLSAFDDTIPDHDTGVICTDEPSIRRKKKIVTCDFSMDSIKNHWRYKGGPVSGEKSCTYRRFRSKFNAEDAEEELRKEISKDMFGKMEIIGQFNLGFIVTKLDEDLFIIDQHATDEKYNFEQLQRDTVLETQLLLKPQTLELTAVSESVLLDNIHVFETNGFKFKINEEEKVGRRVQLISVPVSQNWTFGKGDVDELLFMLADNSGRMCRPSRVSQMFASRACRKSVMIGTSLSQQIMRKLVCHMGEIEHPWNCPHGRPTMRHLLNMNIL